MEVAQEIELLLFQLSVKAYSTFLGGQDTSISHPSFLHFAQAKFKSSAAEGYGVRFLYPALTHRMEILLLVRQAKDTEAPTALTPAHSQDTRPMMGEASREDQRLQSPPS